MDEQVPVGSSSTTTLEAKAQGTELYRGELGLNSLDTGATLKFNKSSAGKITCGFKTRPGELVAGQYVIELWGKDTLANSTTWYEQMDVSGIDGGVLTPLVEDVDHRASVEDRTISAIAVNGYMGPNGYQAYVGEDPPEYGWAVVAKRITLTYLGLSIAGQVNVAIQMYQDANLRQSLRIFRVHWRQNVVAALGALAFNYLYPGNWPRPSTLTIEEAPEDAGFELV